MFSKNRKKEQKFSNFEEMVSAKAWKQLVRNSLPVNISDTYSFSEAMHIVDRLLKASVDEMVADSFASDLMRDYSVNLMKILRAKYPKEWKEDWKNEAYLGIKCGFVYREEESFHHIQKAYKQLADPPQSLILAYIWAGNGPDQFLTKEQIAMLTHKAIAKGITFEAALKMASLASAQGDTEAKKYWEDEALKADKERNRMALIVPNVIKDTFDREGYRYED